MSPTTLGSGGDKWLGGGATNCYTTLVMRRSQIDATLPSSHTPSPHTLARLCKNGHTAVEGWTRHSPPSVSSLEGLLTPINVGNTHWACGVIGFKDTTTTYYDSMSQNMDTTPPS